MFVIFLLYRSKKHHRKNILMSDVTPFAGATDEYGNPVDPTTLSAEDRIRIQRKNAELQALKAEKARASQEAKEAKEATAKTTKSGESSGSSDKK